MAVRPHGTSPGRARRARRIDRRFTDDSLNIGNLLSFLEEDSAPVRHGSYGEASEESGG
jgi:hypothetical protein